MHDLPLPPLGPAATTTERGLRFLRPQLRRCPWWRLTIESLGWTLAYIRPENNPSDPTEPVVAALGWTPEGRWWATWDPLPTTLHRSEPPGDVLAAMRGLIDVLRGPGGDDVGWPAQVPVVVSTRTGRSERNPTEEELSGDLILVILGLEEEGAQRVLTGRQAAAGALDAASLRWPAVVIPEVIDVVEKEAPQPKPRTIRRRGKGLPSE